MLRHVTKKRNKKSVPANPAVPTEVPGSDGNLVAVSAVRSEVRTGPLPPPRDFAEYEQILPGAAERILSMAEARQRHAEARQRHGEACDNRCLSLYSKAQWFSVGIYLATLAAATYAFIQNQTWVAIAIITASPLMRIIVGLLGRKKR